MSKKKRIKFLIIVAIIVAIIILIINLIQGAFSRFKSSTSVVGEGTIAYWAVSDSLLTNTIDLTGLAPSDEPKEYDITISNFDTSNNIAETAIYYEITIDATTYMPLLYQLSEKQTDGTYKVLDGAEVIQDEDGSYMKRLIYTDKFELSEGSVTKQTRDLKLEVYFPSSYKTNTEYSDLIDYINIKFDSKQILDSDDEENSVESTGEI